MTLPPVEAIGAFFFLSELGLSLFKRMRGAAGKKDDRGSMRVIWIVVLCTVVATFAARWLLPQASLASPTSNTWLFPLGFAVFVVGALVRWYSIFYLGRFFTVDVAVTEGHRVVDSGPYRLVRHPSYLGILLEFLGVGICMTNAVSLVTAIVPPLLAFMHRIRIEETVLSDSLGESYRQYIKRTKRMVPFLY